MARSVSLFLFVVLASFVVVDCGKKESPNQSIDQIAQTASKDVSYVKKIYSGTEGANVVVLEENHASRVGQIQHAIALVRLHNQFGLRDICLEGYLKEQPVINTDWFEQCVKGDTIEKAQIAVRLIKEGEISAAEFMKMVYHDILLHPIETSSEYNVVMDEDASRAPLLYLLKIAQSSLTEEHVPRLQELQDEIQTLQGEEQLQKTKELMEYILIADPWAKKMSDFLQNQDTLSTFSSEEIYNLVSEIKNRAEKTSIPIEVEEQDAMERHLEFWKGRENASTTMTNNTIEISNQEDIALVTMMVGAAHTKKICDILESSDCSYAVLRPHSLEKKELTGYLSTDMFQRKYDKLSIYSEGFTKILQESFPTTKYKKPAPVLSQPWFQAKTELYVFIDKISRTILGYQGSTGSSGPPPGGGNPPFGFADDEFRGNWIYIDPNRITIINASAGSNLQAVFFPVLFNPNDENRRKEIWVKAASFYVPVSSEEQGNVEYMLRRALGEIQLEKEMNNRVEDVAGRIQITLTTIAGFATSQQEAYSIALQQI